MIVNTNISGIGSITAVSFFGDGSRFNKYWCSIIPATSANIPVVLTNVTSGTMITGFTDSAI